MKNFGKYMYRALTLPNYSPLQMVLYCTAVATVVGKDGLKTGLTVLAALVVLVLAGLTLVYVEAEYDVRATGQKK